METVDQRGWSLIGGTNYGGRFPERQGRLWTDKEDYDLMQQIEYGVPLSWIADFHQRSLGGISSRLRYPERAEAGAARYKAGIPKPPMKRAFPAPRTAQKWARIRRLQSNSNFPRSYP